MEIDFHFGVTYVLARLAQCNENEAHIIATSSQYVDDTVNSGIVKFKTGERYYRRSTAHEALSFLNADEVDQCQVWVPFHFLPGGVPGHPGGDDYFDRMVCRANSPVATAMIRSCLMDRDQPYALHRLGIGAHVYADTWAHAGFAGVWHEINRVGSIKLVRPAQITRRFSFYWRMLRRGEWQGIISELTRSKLPPLGHAAALHYPDHPFRRWRYRNGHGGWVERDNPQEFLEAAERLYNVFRRYVLRRADAADAEIGRISPADRNRIASMFHRLRTDNAAERLGGWLDAVRTGEFSFGTEHPSYKKAGKGSWKYDALGVEQATIPPETLFDRPLPGFETSNWKLFHDAAHVHLASFLGSAFRMPLPVAHEVSAEQVSGDLSSKRE